MNAIAMHPDPLVLRDRMKPLAVRVPPARSRLAWPGRNALPLIAMATLAGCALIPRPPATPNPAQPDLNACRKVLLPATDASTFGPGAPDCVIVLWDGSMAGVVHPPGQRLLPTALMDAGRAAGYSSSCGAATNDRAQWLRHLPPVDVTLPQREEWIATIFSRGPAQARARAVCELIES